MDGGYCPDKTPAGDSWLRSCRIGSTSVIRADHAGLEVWVGPGLSSVTAKDVHVTVAVARYEYCTMLGSKGTSYSIASW